MIVKSENNRNENPCPIFIFFLAGNSFATNEELLKKLVNINSDSHNISGVNRVQELFAQELRKLGFSIDMISPKHPSKSGNLVSASIKGSSSRKIIFLAHADTVFEKKSSFQKLTRLTPDKWKGPGVMDAKGGMIVILNGLRAFLEKNKAHKYSLHVISSPSEEIGSGEFLQYFRKWGKQADIVLGFEPALPDGSIVDSRRGNRWYKIEVQGKEAHAGRSHKIGRNACHLLAKIITQIQELTNYNEDFTASIGRIEGGKNKFNIVCGTATAKIDTRFSSFKTATKYKKKIEEILKRPSPQGYEVKFEIVDDCPAFSVTKASQEYLKLYRQSISKVEGKKIQSKKSGGAADSNYFNREGLIVLDGLGAVGDNIHTEEEFLYSPSLESRGKALSLFLEKINK